jgi:hypothetical protein
LVRADRKIAYHTAEQASLCRWALLCRQHLVVSFPQTVEFACQVCAVFNSTDLCEQLPSVLKRSQNFTASQSTGTSESNNKSAISTRFKCDINKIGGNINAPSLWIISLAAKYCIMSSKHSRGLTFGARNIV